MSVGEAPCPTPECDNLTLVKGEPCIDCLAGEDDA